MKRTLVFAILALLPLVSIMWQRRSWRVGPVRIAHE